MCKDLESNLTVYSSTRERKPLNLRTPGRAITTTSITAVIPVPLPTPPPTTSTATSTATSTVASTITSTTTSTVTSTVTNSDCIVWGPLPPMVTTTVTYQIFNVTETKTKTESWVTTETWVKANTMIASRLPIQPIITNHPTKTETWITTETLFKMGSTPTSQLRIQTTSGPTAIDNHSTVTIAYPGIKTETKITTEILLSTPTSQLVIETANRPTVIDNHSTVTTAYRETTTTTETMTETETWATTETWVTTETWANMGTTRTTPTRQLLIRTATQSQHTFTAIPMTTEMATLSYPTKSSKMMRMLGKLAIPIRTNSNVTTSQTKTKAQSLRDTPFGKGQCVPCINWPECAECHGECENCVNLICRDPFGGLPMCVSLERIAGPDRFESTFNDFIGDGKNSTTVKP